LRNRDGKGGLSQTKKRRKAVDEGNSCNLVGCFLHESFGKKDFINSGEEKGEKRKSSSPSQGGIDCRLVQKTGLHVRTYQGKKRVLDLQKKKGGNIEAKGEKKKKRRRGKREIGRGKE